MKIQTRFKLYKQIIRLFSILCAVLLLVACSFINQADNSSCSIDIGMRVTIDVSDASPQSVFDQIAREQNCAIMVNPVVRDSITLHMKNATVSEILAAICQQIDCKYSYDGTRLNISPVTLIDKIKMQARERQRLAQEEHFNKFEVWYGYPPATGQHWLWGYP